jgi:hypothetical protein
LLYLELAGASGEAIGTAFSGLSEGVGKVNTQLGVHSRAIVNKKFGEDYVKTFLPEQPSGNEEGTTPK